MFILESAHADQLRRWGLHELAGALAFPAQIGPPPQSPLWKRVAGGKNDSCYRLAGQPDQPGGPAPTLYLKQFRYNPPTWRYLFRPSRARREAANLKTLSRLGIPCPRVVALGEARQASGRLTNLLLLLAGIGLLAGLATAAVGALMAWLSGGRLGGDVLAAGLRAAQWSGGIMAMVVLVLAVLRLAGRAYFAGAALIVTALEPSEDLARFAATRRKRPAAEWPERSAQVRRLARQLAGQLALAHANRFVHGDLKFRNLLVCWPDGQQPAAGNVRLAWIDCPRGRRVWFGPLLRRGRIKDLANLDRNAAGYLSRAERWRFLCDYLEALGGPAALRRRRGLARRIARYNRRHGQGD